MPDETLQPGVARFLQTIARFYASLDTSSSRRGRVYDVLTSLASMFGAKSFSIRGDYGVLQSAVGDRVVLKHYFESGYFARRTNTILAEFFGGEDGLYVDIGANIGTTLIPVAQNPNVRCVAFEPEPVNFANLKANIATNCSNGNVELHNVALYSKLSRLDFELDDKNLGDHRIRFTDTPGLQREETRRVISVEARPLDDWLGIAGPRMAVKIDVQGAEPFVFAGGKEFLSRADLLIFEFSPYAIARTGETLEAINTVLRAFRTLTWAGYEEGATGDPATADQAIWLLLSTYNQYRDNPEVYWDFIARK